MRRLLLAATLAAVLVAPAAAEAATATVKVHESRYGRLLVDGQGRTLYLFTRDGGGTTQVTYAGHPLYYFALDKQPGEAKGQGSKAFGAEWYVVGPAGSKVESGEDAASGSKSSDSSGGGNSGY
jgi:predicted lipoprotein with Yx(FWY)xxD motif